MSPLKETPLKTKNNISETNQPANQTDPAKIPIEKLGFDNWFELNSRAYMENDFSAARVIEVNKNNYKVSNGRQDTIAELSGRFIFNTEERTGFPTVGDWVAVQYFDEGTLAIIHHLFPRKSLLKRKDPGKAVEFQLIAANIDYAFIVQSVDVNFNLNRLARYFVMANESRIEPIVVLSKTDLIPEETLSEIIEKIKRAGSNYLVLPISSIDGNGIERLKKSLMPGKTYCLLGSSGVGKTTLLNRLVGESRFDVKEVREKDHKGRHTTTRRQLIVLTLGSIIIDTPGMRELGNFNVDTGIEETFDDIVSYSKKCRFKDCTHTHEEGCAVKEAASQGSIDMDRYDNFLKIRKESEYYEMSYLEKQKKNKALSKTIKNYKKSIRKK